jgi:hypothetical protein
LDTPQALQEDEVPDLHILGHGGQMEAIGDVHGPARQVKELDWKETEQAGSFGGRLQSVQVSP